MIFFVSNKDKIEQGHEYRQISSTITLLHFLTCLESAGLQTMECHLAVDAEVVLAAGTASHCFVLLQSDWILTRSARAVDDVHHCV
jgi:hypothetical protein